MHGDQTAFALSLKGLGGSNRNWSGIEFRRLNYALIVP